ncbi:MAG TPA: phosphoribosyltransferase family protein [Aromatoleum sp.]|uniref:phosphoribosyltransferase n=1 Tax=Aromatoleum sp. TaxID=2307007 RepID=UPI002B48F6DA|nr:phosphoribosyltransferase family protein [Aromatoleum sp.]HJV24508.1 phosphoribosyltransferase family protein [Aromatoleum sp.]
MAELFRGQALTRPLVLAIPRGGVVTGAALARELNAELDVVLARKLRAPWQPELAIGAIGEDGAEYLADFAREVRGFCDAYLAEERAQQLAEIERRRQMFRAVKPAAEVAGRTVIVTDDGIATGATMLAALHVIRARKPLELIAAIPVSPPETAQILGRHCDRVECVITPTCLGAVGSYYWNFTQIEDEEALETLRRYEFERR